jgi:hypothetical protein
MTRPSGDSLSPSSAVPVGTTALVRLLRGRRACALAGLVVCCDAQNGEQPAGASQHRRCRGAQVKAQERARGLSEAVQLAMRGALFVATQRVLFCLDTDQHRCTAVATCCPSINARLRALRG